jgi:LmbE family N-acetylglucosaminyl deacetylase
VSEEWLAAVAIGDEPDSARVAAPERVLAIGAHPDDVEIGVGGTLAKHQAAGDRVTILTLSGGSVGSGAREQHAEALAAAGVLGARLIHLDFEDSRLDPAAGVSTAIAQVIAELRPDRVYTHSVHDRDQDHWATHESVEIAARRVPNLACFQSPSSTVDFRPDRFIDIGAYLDTKLRTLAAFASQGFRDYMQEDVVRATARYWSRFGVGRFVEPLETVRSSVRLTPLPGRAGEPAAGPTS